MTAPAPMSLDEALGREVPDRLFLLTLTFLFLPGLLFLGGWAQLWVSLLAGGAGAAAVALAPGWRGPWPLRSRTTLLCLLAGLVWAGAAGPAHWLYATADWQVRDAVLRDLAVYAWPVAYDEEVIWLLRAPLGYFLPAAAVGRLVGFEGAQVALWLWTGAALGLLLMMLTCLARRLGVSALMLGLVFVFFGGLDFLPNVVLDWRFGTGPFAAWGRGGEWWNRAFQYPGHVTSMLWAPNHTLPAWLCALMLLRHGRTAGFAVALGPLLASAAFWSPVATAGAAALAIPAVLLAGRWREAVASPANWLAVGFFVPLGLYLVAGAGRVPHGFLFAMREDGWYRWPIFLAVEVLPWAIPAWALLRGRILLGATALLCIVPLYVFGPGNEAASRGSQAALAILAVAGGAALLQAPPGGWRNFLRGVAAIAFAGSLMEASLLIEHEPWEASERCTVLEAARQSVFRDTTDWSHYIAPWPDPTLERWMQVPHPRPLPERSIPCWPGGTV
ncbi:hypothetical protein [Sabulicella glaciei]|nr:hypothetical protein [Roseococcus sp. MDT2-1-1]